jgi:hypothetical protein
MVNVKFSIYNCWFVYRKKIGEMVNVKFSIYNCWFVYIEKETLVKC